MITCSRCLFNELTPNITFKNGQCNYCELHDKLDELYPTNKKKLVELGNKIKIKSNGAHDCVVGISGGCDSSFMLHLTVKVMKLNPLVVHFDNGFDTDISINNMNKMCNSLGVDLEIRKVDKYEYTDIYHSFFKAGLPDIEAVTDLALMSALYKFAYAYKIKNIFIGHSFRTEGISPLGFGSYMDSRYVRDVQIKYGTCKIKTLPELRILEFLKYMFNGIKRIRPLYYIDYDKEQVKQFLADEYGWKWYGGLHKESIITDYVKNYWTWERYGIDKRITEFSGLVRTGILSREEANKILSKHPEITNETHKETIKLLGFDPNQYLCTKKRTYKDFKNYKKLFKVLRPLFWVFLKLDRIPLSFYSKYCY